MPSQEMDSAFRVLSHRSKNCDKKKESKVILKSTPNIQLTSLFHNLIAELECGAVCGDPRLITGAVPLGSGLSGRDGPGNYTCSDVGFMKM